MGEHWNTAATVKVVVDACGARGVDTAPILVAAGIDATTLADPDGRVSLDQMRRFWQEVVAQSGDPAIALRAGAHVPAGVYKTVDFLLAYSRTVGEGFKLFARFLPVANSWLVVEVEEGEQECRFLMRAVWGAQPRPSAEYVMGVLVCRARRAWHEDWAPREVRFSFPEPEDTSAYREVLGCPVSFGAPQGEMIIDRALFDAKVQAHDPNLVAFLEQQTRDLLERLPRASDLVARVRASISDGLVDRSFALDEVAGRVGMTGRTLQRNLSDEGLAFGDVVDEVRLEAAKQRLADSSLALAEVAYTVGFAEQSSFSRAFKRWTGETPRAYRTALRAK